MNMTKTIRLTEVLAADAQYVDADSAAAIEGLPAAAWPALVEAVAELNGAGDPGIDCGVAKTHETLADFDASRDRFWTEKGRRTECTVGGLPAIKYERFQLSKGAQRRDQIVVDCGDCRAALILG